MITSTQWEGWLTYGELIEERGGNQVYLKAEELSYKYNWLEYLQIKDLFKKDKREKGLRLILSDLEIIMLETGKNEYLNCIKIIGMVLGQ